MANTTMANPLISRRNIGISFATQYVELAIQFAAVLVLARLLSPQEIGTFSVAAFLMTMLHVFRDFGVTQYVIQVTELNREKIQAAIGVAIVLASLVALALFSMSGMVARFYGNPELERLLWVMSASFAISPFGSVLLGLLRRNGQLKEIFIIKLVSALCHVTVAVTLALHGYGAISLAWANFAGILGFGMAGNLVRPKNTPWLPRFDKMREVLSFGSLSSLGNLATNAGQSAPELVLGKVANMVAVGYFSRATGLVQLFTRLISSALTPLMLPYFSQTRREGGALDVPYLRAVELLTALAWPFFVALMALAFPVIRLLYGPQWDVSVPVARILCAASAIAVLTLFANQAMIANGQIRIATKCNLFAQPLRILAALVGAYYGLMAVATGLLIAECVALVVVSRFLQQSIDVTWARVMYACRKSVVVTAATSVGPMLAWAWWEDDPRHLATSLSFGVSVGAAGWLMGLLLTAHPLAVHLLAPFGRAAPSTSDIKSSLLRLVYATGVLGRWHAWRNRRSLTVSMFHRVLPRTDARHAGADPEWTMTPENFDACLKFFKRHYHLVTAQQVFAALRGQQRLPSRAMLVTFDDGWADTAEFAQPVLDDNGISALVFVAAGAVDRAEPFWEERLYSFLATQPDALPTLRRAMAAQNMAPLVDEPVGIDESAIRSVVRQLGGYPREQVLSLQARLPHAGAAFPAMLTTPQLCELARRGHAIGGHGMTHQPLTKVDALEQEMRAGQDVLASFLHNGPIQSMSLPHGAMSAEVLAECRAAGFHFVFSSSPELNATDHLTGNAALAPIGRIHISERAVTGPAGRLDPARLARWTMLRPIRPIGQEARHGDH